MSFIWRTRHPMVARQRYVDQQRAKRKAFYAANPEALIQSRIISALVLVVVFIVMAFCSAR